MLGGQYCQQSFQNLQLNSLIGLGPTDAVADGVHHHVYKQRNFEINNFPLFILHCKIITKQTLLILHRLGSDIHHQTKVLLDIFSFDLI